MHTFVLLINSPYRGDPWELELIEENPAGKICMRNRNRLNYIGTINTNYFTKILIITNITKHCIFKSIAYDQLNGP